MVKRYFHYLSAILLAATISLMAAGCSQQVHQIELGDPTAIAEQAGKDDSRAVNQQRPAINETPMGQEENLDNPGSGFDKSQLAISAGRTTDPMLPIYYDFDKSSIREDQKGKIEDNAQYLKENRVGLIVIEGNCDERGTNEYNMALGERRAMSAKKYLVNLGVSADYINTISYGEERPLNYGHDELAWSENRRSDFVEIR